MNSSHTFAITSPFRIARVRDFVALSGRICITAIFLITGLGKISDYSGTVNYMESAGIHGGFLPFVILTELFGAVAIIIGYRTRAAALLLAGFTMLTASVFHHDIADQNQALHLLKNLAIAGGFLILSANGPGSLSVDQRSESPTPANRGELD